MMPYLIIVLVWLADRLTKIWAASFLAENGTTQINSILTIRETYNRGIAFGMFQGIGPLIGWLSIFIVLGMVIYLVKVPHDHRLERLGLALIIGGALGNLYDRITAGQVLDFIEIPLKVGIFNIADIALNVGIILLVISLAIAEIQRRSQISEESHPTA